MRSHAKHAGNYASSVSCANKNDESTVVPTQHNYVHLNFINLNGRTKYKISFVEKKELSFFFECRPNHIPIFVSFYMNCMHIFHP